MKNKVIHMIMLLALLLVALVLMPCKADAQVVPNTATVLTTSTSAVAAATTATVTSQAFEASQETGFALVPVFALSGTGAANVTFSLQASTDGTNWTTTTPLTYAVAATGTTPVRGYANFPANAASSSASNVRYWRLGSVTNANTPSTLTISSVTISKDTD